MSGHHNQLVIRKARERDLATLVGMLADDKLGKAREDTSTPLHDGYAKAFAAIDQDPNQFLAVAERGGEIVGCLQLTFIPGLSYKGALRGQIESVRIASSERGKRLGRELLLWAIEQCRARGCRFAQLATNKSRTEARRFYEDLGFEATHEGMKLTL